MRDGVGTTKWADGDVDVIRFSANTPVGVGARWSAERGTAWRLRDGEEEAVISLDEAAAIAADIGLPPPTESGTAATAETAT